MLFNSSMETHFFLFFLFFLLYGDVYFEHTWRYKKDDHQRTQRLYIKKLLQTK